MFKMNVVTDYICNKYYYVVYKNNYLTESTQGLLLSYVGGNIILLADDGVYHIKNNDILIKS